MPAFPLVPVVSRLIHRVCPGWVLTGGFAMIAVAGSWCSTSEITTTTWTALIAPLLCLGLDFAPTVGSITAVAPDLAGMASATTNLLRALGFALGPVLVGGTSPEVAGVAADVA